MSAFEPFTLYIALTFLGGDAGKNFYHWTLYATGSNPPKGIKFHATDRGDQRNPLRYEHGEVNNPMASKNMVVCLKIGPANSVQEIHQSLKKVPLGSAKSLPRRESRWTCRVFLTFALKQLDQDHIIALPPGMDVDEIEAACYQQADHYYSIKKRTRKVGPAIVNDVDWLHWDGSSSMAGPSSSFQMSYGLPTGTLYATDPMETERDSYRPKPYYGPKPMNTDPESYYSAMETGS